MPIELIDANWFKGKWMMFHDLGPVSKGASTHLFKVMDRKRGIKIGAVKWQATWRQYCLFPLNAIFNKECLREAADFCEQMTNEYRELRKAERKGK